MSQTSICLCVVLEAVTNWVALHGWLDNAGSFDTLAPQLVAECPRHALLCLDYPGHGRSSHLPPGQVSAATS